LLHRQGGIQIQRATDIILLHNGGIAEVPYWHVIPPVMVPQTKAMIAPVLKTCNLIDLAGKKNLCFMGFVQNLAYRLHY